MSWIPWSRAGTASSRSRYGASSSCTSRPPLVYKLDSGQRKIFYSISWSLLFPLSSMLRLPYISSGKIIKKLCVLSFISPVAMLSQILNAARKIFLSLFHIAGMKKKSRAKKTNFLKREEGIVSRKPYASGSN